MTRTATAITAAGFLGLGLQALAPVATAGDQPPISLRGTAVTGGVAPSRSLRDAMFAGAANPDRYLSASKMEGSFTAADGKVTTPWIDLGDREQVQYLIARDGSIIRAETRSRR